MRNCSRFWRETWSPGHRSRGLSLTRAKSTVDYAHAEALSALGSHCTKVGSAVVLPSASFDSSTSTRWSVVKHSAARCLPGSRHCPHFNTHQQKCWQHVPLPALSCIIGNCRRRPGPAARGTFVSPSGGQTRPSRRNLRCRRGRPWDRLRSIARRPRGRRLVNRIRPKVRRGRSFMRRGAGALGASEVVAALARQSS